MKQIEEYVPHFYSFTRWKQFPLIAGFTDRMFNFAIRADSKRKNTLLAQLGLTIDSIIFPKQVHGGTVYIIDKSTISRLFKCDGLVTHEIEIPLAILTADCAPLFFFLPSQGVIGIAHAGWKGILNGIVLSMINTIAKGYNVEVNDMQVGIGPAIRSCCYQIGEDVANLFKEGITNKDGQLYLDLIHIIKGELIKKGVISSHIIDSEICTSCQSNRFFSYRKECNNVGRMLSLIMLKNE